MKKLAVIMIALALSVNLVACGGGETPAPSSVPSSAPAPVSTPESDPASTPEADAEEELVYELDYTQIASWVAGGFIGNDESGAPVVMAIDAADEYAIIIFGDNDDMTAVSFIGEITYEGDLATITDEANEMSLTFGIEQIPEVGIQLDMGEEIGKAIIQEASKDEVLATIKTAIDSYEHVA